ncbi:MAG: hypothetical protein KME08_21270 [Aphanothece sp. CMT-3BRIN-NPC111]|jgi:hypothetical protein|nr:hypothetical protein [Aphanothece sp. CMT-3BRIN-NPC111]
MARNIATEYGKVSVDGWSVFEQGDYSIWQESDRTIVSYKGQDILDAVGEEVTTLNNSSPSQRNWISMRELERGMEKAQVSSQFLEADQILDATARAKKLIGQPTDFPQPLTTQEVLAHLEFDAEYWESTDLEGAERVAAVRREAATELRLLGAEPDPQYRTKLSAAQSEMEDKSRYVVMAVNAAIKEPGGSLSQICSKMQMPPALVVAARQVESLPAGQVKTMVADFVVQAGTQAVQQATQIPDRVKSMLSLSAQAQTQIRLGIEQVKHTSQQVTTQAHQTIEAANVKVSTFVQKQQVQTVASTTRMLAKFGAPEALSGNPNSPNEPINYRGEKYDIKREKNIFTISDKEGNTLLKASEHFWGFKEIENNLSSENIREFLEANQKIGQHGLGALSMAAGRQHLGALAPEGEKERIHQARTSNFVKDVGTFLDLMETENWNSEQSHYNLLRSKEHGLLKVDLKIDPTGQERQPQNLLKIEKKQVVHNQLSNGDFAHFGKVMQVVKADIARQQQTHQQSSTLATPAAPRRLIAVGIDLE